MLPGAIASTITTRGRQREKSMPAMTSASAPSTSILRKSMRSSPASAHSAASVRTGLRIVVYAGAELAARRQRARARSWRNRAAFHDVELGLALGAPGEAAHRVVARTHVRVDIGQRLLRLHDQAAPALEVEPERDVVRHRMAAADIDVGAVRLAGEDQIEVVVLQVLRIGELHHFAWIGVQGFRRLVCSEGLGSLGRIAASSIHSRTPSFDVAANRDIVR